CSCTPIRWWGTARRLPASNSSSTGGGCTDSWASACARMQCTPGRFPRRGTRRRFPWPTVASWRPRRWNSLRPRTWWEPPDERPAQLVQARFMFGAAGFSFCVGGLFLAALVPFGVGRQEEGQGGRAPHEKLRPSLSYRAGAFGGGADDGLPAGRAARPRGGKGEG